MRERYIVTKSILLVLRTDVWGDSYEEAESLSFKADEKLCDLLLDSDYSIDANDQLLSSIVRQDC